MPRHRANERAVPTVSDAASFVPRRKHFVTLRHDRTTREEPDGYAPERNHVAQYDSTRVAVPAIRIQRSADHGCIERLCVAHFSRIRDCDFEAALLENLADDLRDACGAAGFRSVAD